MQIPTLRPSSGFTLIESLIAMAILVTAFAGLAQVILHAGKTASDDWRRQVASTAAQSKLEWLRSRRLAFDANGTEVTDEALKDSPAGALERDVDGYHEVLDDTGAPGEPATGHAAAFVRRWSVVSSRSAISTVAIEVCVFLWPARDGRESAEPCVGTIRARQP